jgi:hypothetical protein
VLRRPLAGADTLHGLGEQDCRVAFPARQLVAAPISEKPEEQLNSQLLPEASVTEQLLRVPLAGAAREQLFGAQLCADVRLPARHEMLAPTTLYPLAQLMWQVEPDARLEGQFPISPCVGAETAQGFAAQVCSVTLPALQLVALPCSVNPAMQLN